MPVSLHTEEFVHAFIFLVFAERVFPMLRHRFAGKQCDATAMTTIRCVIHVDGVVVGLTAARQPHLWRET